MNETYLNSPEMKLWQKNGTDTAEVDRFTVGLDREMDLSLARADLLGSLAHTRMLATIGLLAQDELTDVQRELKAIYRTVEQGDFRIEEDIEDIHSQVELLLTRRIGETGKKIHSGRSRNDQVLVDLRIYLRREIYEIVGGVERLFRTLQRLAEQHREVLMPGYTHLQIAMPSSFGLWFAEGLVDDLTMMEAAYRVCNKNPLGSAAGYGSSFPLDREMTTRLLGFDTMSHNVVYAQMGRGKTERLLAQAMSAVAATLNKLATDNCLFLSAGADHGVEHHAPQEKSGCVGGDAQQVQPADGFAERDRADDDQPADGLFPGFAAAEGGAFSGDSDAQGVCRDGRLHVAAYRGETRYPERSEV